MRKRKRNSQVEQLETVEVEAANDAVLSEDDIADVEHASHGVEESPQETDAEGDGLELQALVEAPEAAVQRLTAELEEQQEKYLRLAAEFDNFRKRVERQRSEIRQTARSEIVRSILETLDNLARVTSLEVADARAEDVIAGVDMVERNLLKELEAVGLVKIGREDELFDPNDHEAVATAQAPVPEKEDRVAAVLQVGYRFGGILLRPARVQVYVASSVD